MKRLFPCLLSLALVVAISGPASANRTQGRTPIPIDGKTIRAVKIGTPASPHVACTLGETRPPAWINPGYLVPPDDRYYTELKISDCPGCGPGGLLITNAHLVLYYEATCILPVEVSIVPAILGPSGCEVPDTQHTLCGPSPDLLPGDAGNGYDFSLALAQPCCITQDAFLLVRFVDLGNCATPPDLVAADPPCNPCVSYNLNPSFGFVDMCADPFWTQYLTGNPNMYVDADCCTITPTVPNSWGRLKLLYR
jgi:hypothetical protein